MPDLNREIKRVPGFEYLHADTLGFQFNDNGIKIVFGVEDLNGSVLEQMGVALPIAAGKLLLLMLMESFKRHEARTGREVPIDPSKLEEIMKVFTDADAQREAAQNQG